MRINQEGLALIREFESCSLTAYQDRGGIWTIGWGSTAGVTPDMIITQAEADSRFLADLQSIETPLAIILAQVALNENQWSALVSFCFNVGFGKKGVKMGFACLLDGEPSTMLQCLTRGDCVGAAREFPKWIKIGGIPSAGLAARRARERALFEEAPDGNDGSLP